ncbi:MAG: sigma-54-dependent Fis family transcriptional regulator, partial [Candidatus Omnitrophica bacterium]|nr:sigma-54-dependent Fis family transcriptional regulator [Candidatus Omnitrophota bacterium]
MYDAPRLLIADDEPGFLDTTAELLRGEGYSCYCAKDGDTAMRILESEPIDLVISDLNMPGNFSMEWIHSGRRRYQDVPVIVVTGFPTLETAIDGLRCSVSDYLLKPFEIGDLIQSIERTLSRQVVLETPIEEMEGFTAIVGETEMMKKVRRIAAQVAQSDASVLISGETGTGKELLARTIHHNTSRRDQAFNVIDCTAIPESLMESILFGHSQGSFTSATRDQIGLLALSEKGTTFFDEIGEMPLNLQAKLLRFLEEKTFLPLGKKSPVSVDTKIIAATNRNLEEFVEEGQFRKDLYYRLAVVPINIPPLRDRIEDIPLLTEHFLRGASGRLRVVGVTSQAMKLLKSYDWPGNIRELRNVLEHALTFCQFEKIDLSDLPPRIKQVPQERGIIAGRDSDGPTSRKNFLEVADQKYLEGLLKRHRGNVTSAAKEAGISRQSLHKIMSKYNFTG